MGLNYRYDKGSIKRTYIDADGFLNADAIVTRTGVFTYRNNDGTLRKELRHPDDILKQDSLKTMEMLPITLLHPPEKKVDADNVSRLQKGFTGSNIVVDGKFIRNKLKVCDQVAIDSVMNGTQELSLGYLVALIEEAGEYEGERYDFRQTEVTYNHLAIVPSARAGSEAKITLDADDAIQEIKTDDTIIKPTKIKTDYKQNHSQINKETRMKKITLDGIEYEASPEVINALNAKTTKLDSTVTELSMAKEETVKIQAKLDEANDKLEIAKKANNDEAVQIAVQTRLALVSEASPHLDAEAVKTVNDMTDKDIKLAVIKSHFPEAKLDGKDDVYIGARYDGAIEMKTEKETNTDENITSQRKALNLGDGSNKDAKTEPDQEKSRNDMNDSLVNAWKNKTEKA